MFPQNCTLHIVRVVRDGNMHYLKKNMPNYALDFVVLLDAGVRSMRQRKNRHIGRCSLSKHEASRMVHLKQ